MSHSTTSQKQPNGIDLQNTHRIWSPVPRVNVQERHAYTEKVLVEKEEKTFGSRE